MGFKLENIEKFLNEDDFSGDVVDNGFEMNPIDDAYEVMKNGNIICKVEFIDKNTEKSTDMEVAQSSPTDYIVVFSNIKDFANAEEYEQKLSDIGFEINLEQR